MNFPRIAKAGFFLIAPAAVVVLMAAVFPPRLTDGVTRLGSVTGTWAGDFTWLDGSRSYPVSVTIRPDGSYVFDSVHRNSEGRVKIERGRIQLLEEGYERVAAFARGLAGGRPVLTGGIENIGTYYLNKTN